MGYHNYTIPYLSTIPLLVVQGNQYSFDDPDRFEGGRPRLPKDRTAFPAARNREVRRGGGSTEASREPGRERSADDSRDEFSRDDGRCHAPRFGRVFRSRDPLRMKPRAADSMPPKVFVAFSFRSSGVEAGIAAIASAAGVAAPGGRAGGGGGV